MARTVVHRWHLDPDLKRRLESAARAEKTSVARLLERIAREWLGRHGPDHDDEEKQRRLHAAGEEWIGSLSLGEGPYARKRIRERVRKRWHRCVGSD